MAFHSTRQYNFKYLGLDQLIGGGWPDNCAEVSSLDWQTGAGKCSYASFFCWFFQFMFQACLGKLLFFST
jgi:hypothetical protein